MKEPEKEEMWTSLFELAWILEGLKMLSKRTFEASTVARIDPKSWVGIKLMNAFEDVQYQIPSVPSLNTVQSQPF
jgi:hypothetical protein